MDESDYKRVCRIINYVLRQPHLTEEDREEIRQEAALAAWKYGFTPTTRIYWAALDAARRIRKHRIYDSIEFDLPDRDDVEGTVVGFELLSVLTERERFAIEGCLRGYSQEELGKMINLGDSQISRYRSRGLKKLKQQL